MLQYGAQIDIKDDKNQTPIDIAWQKGFQTILYYLKNPNMTEEEVKKMAKEEKTEKKAEKKAKRKAEKNVKAVKKSEEKAEKEANPSSANDIMARDYYSILGVKKGTPFTEEPQASAVKSDSLETTKFQFICHMCLRSPTASYVLNCGHLPFCEDCSILFIRKGKKCPICKSLVTSRHRTYIDLMKTKATEKDDSNVISLDDDSLDAFKAD